MLTVGLGIGFLMFVAILFGSRAYLNNMDALEKKQFTLEIERVNELLNTNVKYISSKSSDWAIWDDSYKFVEDKNESFIKSNVSSPLVFENLHINFMAFVDNKGKVVFEKAYNLNSLEEAIVPKDVYNIFNNQKLTSQVNNSTGGVSGIIVLSEGPAIISVRPILTSLGTGPSNGVIIFGRFIDDNFITEIKETTKQEKIKFYLTSDEKLPEDEKEILPKLIADGMLIKDSDNTKSEGWGMVNDIYNNPSIFYGLYKDRDLYTQALNGVQTLSMILGGATVIFISIVWLILGKLVLNPLKNVTNEINNIAKNKNFTSRLKIQGTDEFSLLASDINSMLINLENLSIEGEMKTKDLADKMSLIAEKNLSLESSKSAILNILDDEKELQIELKKEKESVDQKVIERTKEVAEEKAKLISSIQALSKAFVMIDLNNNINLTNENLDNVLGVKKDNWTVKDIINILGSSFDFEDKYKKVIEDKKRVEYDNIIFGTKILQIRFSPVFKEQSKKEEILGILAIIGDVTEEKVLERSKDEFFSIASHELRTPLTAIRGNTSMILDYYKDQVKDPELKSMIVDTHDASIRLIGIVNDFLDLSRLEQGRMKYTLSDFNILDVILDVTKELKVNATKKGIKLDTDVDKNIIVKADSDKVKQVLFNIIGNSIKFTEKGSVTISSEIDEERVKILIKDTGQGIPLVNQSLLFRKFQQAGTSTLTRDGAKGTGLGLYISKLIVEGLGGKIALESSVEGKGSVFTFTLPTAKL